MSDPDRLLPAEPGDDSPRTVVEHVAPPAPGGPPAAADEDLQQARTVLPVSDGPAQQPTRFLRALRALRVADMATLAPLGPLPGALQESSLTGAVTAGDGTADDGDALIAVRHDEKYRLGRELGRGGMGIVRKARDEHLERHVAMKTLRDGPGADPRLVALLVREARLTGQLEHPNIVPVYDLGTLEDGAFFYTMRLYREVTLASILQGLRDGDAAVAEEFDQESLLQIFRQTCMAVAFAHARGVVHRDLKPGNILVGDYGEVQVTDWGVAQVLPNASVTVPPIAVQRGAVRPGHDSREVGLVGTPQYMAPEQARGEDGGDPRADVYSLGVLLYEIATLQLPYSETRDMQRLLAEVAEGRILAPESRNPQRPVPEELAAILRRALALDPHDRYPTAKALWDAVAAWVQGTTQRRRRAERARAEIALGEEASRRYYEILEQQRRSAERIAELQATVKPWHPLSERQRISALRDQRDRLEIHLGAAFSQATDRYVRALVHEPDNATARISLARLYWSKLLPAVERNDYQNIVYLGDLVRQLSDPREGPLESGTATVSIRTLPEGAHVWIHDIGALALGAPAGDALTDSTPPAGDAPLMEVPLASGVYIVVARAEGFREARRPLLLRAGDAEEVLLTLAPLHEDRPMVGRDGELGRMKALFQSACENRRPAFCLVRGAAGMGKTKLLEAFEGFLDDLPETVFVCYAEPRRTHPQLPFAALADLFSFRAGIKLADERDTRERKLVEMTRQAISRNGRNALTSKERLEAEETAGDLGLLPGLLEPPSRGRAARSVVRSLADELDPSELRRRIFKGVVGYFRTLSQWQPVYLRIRAAHRLDRSTLQILGQLRRGGAIFVLGDVPTAGPWAPPEAGPAAEPAGAGRPEHRPGEVRGTWVGDVGEELRALFDAEVALPTFDRLSVERFAANYLDGPVTPQLVDELAHISRGRPGHLEVLLPLLAETGAIVRHDGHWGLGAAALPPAAELGYARAVDRLVLGPLTPEQRQVLHLAAVAGRVFSREELLALGCEDPDRLAGALMERQVFRHRPTAGLLWTEVFAFATETLWEIAYREIPAEECAALHLKLARYLAAIPDPPPEGVALMADHFGRAGQREEAARCLLRLADHARRLAADHEEALNRRLADELRGEHGT